MDGKKIKTGIGLVAVENRRYFIYCYRAKMFNADIGHHSPHRGYLEVEDLVLVLEFSSLNQPWLIESSRLFAAMDTFDGGKRRGLLLIE